MSIEQFARVVAIECGPRTVARSHRQRPAASRARPRRRRAFALAALEQREHDDRRVVDVGIDVVVELERPAVAVRLLALHRASRRARRRESARAASSRRRARIAGCDAIETGDAQRAHRPRRIPHRRHAGQKTPSLRASSIEKRSHAVDALVASPDGRGRSPSDRARSASRPTAAECRPSCRRLPGVRRSTARRGVAPRRDSVAGKTFVEFVQPLDQHQPVALAAHRLHVRLRCRERQSRARRRPVRAPAASTRRSSAVRPCRAPSRRSRKD